MQTSASASSAGGASVGPGRGRRHQSWRIDHHGQTQCPDATVQAVPKWDRIRRRCRRDRKCDPDCPGQSSDGTWSCLPRRFYRRRRRRLSASARYHDPPLGGGDTERLYHRPRCDGDSRRDKKRRERVGIWRLFGCGHRRIADCPLFRCEEGCCDNTEDGQGPGFVSAWCNRGG